jgi:hypothetical protein
MSNEGGIPLMHKLIDPLCKELAGLLLELPYHHSLDICDQINGPLMLTLSSPNSSIAEPSKSFMPSARESVLSAY